MVFRMHDRNTMSRYYWITEYVGPIIKLGIVILFLGFAQDDFKNIVAAQGGPGTSSNLRPGPYSPIQNIFFGPLLRGAERPPLPQRGHPQHQQPQIQKQQSLQQQNSKQSLHSNAALLPPPPPPPPVPSRSPKSIGDEQQAESSTAPPAPSIPPSRAENGGANRKPPVSGPGRPSPNPGLILTPNIEPPGTHFHHPQQHPLQRHKKQRKNQIGKRPTSQLPGRRLPPPRHRPPIHHSRGRGPPRLGPIPLPPKKLKKLGIKKNNIPPNDKLHLNSNRGQNPHLPPRGTPPTPTIRSPATNDNHQHHHFIQGQGITPPYGSATGVTPTVIVPVSRDVITQSSDEFRHHHGSPTPSTAARPHTTHVHQTNRHPFPERNRRPSGIVDISSRPLVHSNVRPQQQPRTASEALTANSLPPPPPPPVIVDQLHRDIPKSGPGHHAETHHHPPQQTNTLNIQQQNHRPLEAPETQHLRNAYEEQQRHQNNLSQDEVIVLEPITRLPHSSLQPSHISSEANSNQPHHPHHNEHILNPELPIPQPQQQLLVDLPSNALYNDPDAVQDSNDSHHTAESHNHHGTRGHHDHHKHKDHGLENYHLPDDVLLKISPRGHSSGPVIISQIPVKSFQSAEVPLSVKEPMPEKNKYPFIDAVPATSLAGSGAAIAQLLTAEARPFVPDSLKAQPRSDDGNNLFYFSQPSDLSASDSEVSSQVAFNSQRLKTKDKIGGVENNNLFRREQNGSPRQLRKLDEGHDPIHSDNADTSDVEHLHAGNANHIDGGVSDRRIDNEVVRELVDCGGSDLGFCDMNSRYPGHMMGNLMSDCQELVYRGFVPVPEDLEELGDNDPLAKYSNASKSAVRARTGSWSWKPYQYKKKQICSSELRFIRPGYARDSTGKWQVIVQTESLPQRVAIDLCHNPQKPCHLMSDCGRKSRCIQRYTFQHLLAVDPDNLHDCPTIRAFKFPAACVCHIEFPDYRSEFF